jgi:hypothetical protein
MGDGHRRAAPDLTTRNQPPALFRLIGMGIFRFPTVVLVIVLLTGCGARTPTESVFTVTGYAHAGPMCPAQRYPPDPACADRPVAGATVFILDAGGDEVAELQTDAAGRFEASLPAGVYTLVPQPVEGLLGTAPTQIFTAGPDHAAVLDLAYDTGIR